MACFRAVDLSKNFYFSYTYDITSSLQRNLTLMTPAHTSSDGFSFNDRFAWNHHLLRPFEEFGAARSDWVLPMIQGHVDQASASLSRSSYGMLTVYHRAQRAGSRSLHHAHCTTVTTLRRSALPASWRERRCATHVFYEPQS